MIEFEDNKKILQTIHGHGWRALVSCVVDRRPAEECPVVAWLLYQEDCHPQRPRFTAIIQRRSGDLAALTYADYRVLYLAPGQERTPEHDALLASRCGARLNPELASTVGLWGYIGCHRVENVSANGVHIAHDCGACGNRDLRFVHTLYQPDDLELGRLEVCIECARILIGDVEWDIPGDAENELRGKL